MLRLEKKKEPLRVALTLEGSSWGTAPAVGFTVLFFEETPENDGSHRGDN